MKESYTHFTVILDRSGSMEEIRKDVIGGFNAFLKEQKNHEGEATLTLVQFDSQDPYEVIADFKNIKDVRPLTAKNYVPRSSTPLLDALGRGINDLQTKLDELAEEDRPEKVVMVIVTDGQENSSREFRLDRIQVMIREKKEKYDWQFIFLSSDMDAIRDSHEQGFDVDSSLHFVKDAAGTAMAFSRLSRESSDYRSRLKEKLGFDKD